MANAGSTAGITCFSVDKHQGLKALGGLRPVPQTQLTDPTIPPPGPLVLIADITFNPSQTALFASVRSNGGEPGLLYAYPVQDGQVGRKEVVSSFPTLPFAFSLNFLDFIDEHLLVLNPHLNSPGAAFVSVSYPLLEITLTKTITIPGQMASCWAAYAPWLDSVFVLDALQTNVTVLNPETGDVKGQVNFDAIRGGGSDSRVDRKWLYTLTDFNILADGVTPDPVIEVFDVSGGQVREVQRYDILEGVGPIQFWMGMAIFSGR